MVLSTVALSCLMHKLCLAGWAGMFTGLVLVTSVATLVGLTLRCMVRTGLLDAIPIMCLASGTEIEIIRQPSGLQPNILLVSRILPCFRVTTYSVGRVSIGVNRRAPSQCDTNNELIVAVQPLLLVAPWSTTVVSLLCRPLRLVLSGVVRRLNDDTWILLARGGRVPATVRVHARVSLGVRYTSFDVRSTSYRATLVCRCSWGTGRKSVRNCEAI